MTEGQRTFGDFFAEVEKTDFIEAQTFLEEWVGMVSKEEWERIKTLPLTSALVATFARDMAAMFSDRITGICTEELYEHVLREAHTFLRHIHQKAVENGINVTLKEIDRPLTPTEMMAVAGLVKVSKDGMVTLSPEGKKAAEEVEREIHFKDN